MGQLRQQKNNSQRTDATTKDKRATANKTLTRSHFENCRTIPTYPSQYDVNKNLPIYFSHIWTVLKLTLHKTRMV